MNLATIDEGTTMQRDIPKGSRGLLIAVRFLTSLALSLWIGGMAFFGIMAAPVMFRLARQSSAPEVAPQMVGAMLTRFGFVTTICAVLMIICWFIDGALSGSRAQRLWKVQGGLSLICLALSLYLNGYLLPRTQAQQPDILPIFARDARGENLTQAEIAKRATFDKGHKEYQRLASVNLYLLLGVMGILIARGVGETGMRRAESL